MTYNGDVSTLRFTGERVVPNGDHDILQAGLLTIHQAIYQVIAASCTHKQVLDLGCGTGHGMQMIERSSPARVWGADLAPEAVRYAAHRYPATARRLVVCDALQLAFAPARFDVVSAVEVIEHVPSARALLDQVRYVLKPDGTCFVSTPNRLTHSPGSPRPINPFHVAEYTYSELEALLRQAFKQVRIDCIRIARRGFLARYQPHALDPALPFPLANAERFLYWHVPPWARDTLRLGDVTLEAWDDPQCWGFLASCSEPIDTK
jgi:SAM-dependent methyltransferase